MHMMNEQIEQLSNQLISIFSPNNAEDTKVIRSGQMLYRQNMVTIQQELENILTAYVADVHSVKVKLNLNDIHLSYCSCPANSICRHKVAVFFTLFSNFSSVNKWLEDWRSQITDHTFDKLKHIQTASEVLAQKKQLPFEALEWKQFIYSTFHSHFEEKTNDQHINERWKLYKYQLSIHSPMEREWKQLYELYCHFYTYILLNHTIDYSIHSTKWNPLFESCLERLDDILYKMSVQTSFFAFDEFYELLKGDCLTPLSHPQMENFNIRFYRLLWTKLFKKRDDWQHLLQALDAFNKDETRIYRMLLLLQLKEASFFEELKHLSITYVPHLFEWIDLFIYQKEDDRTIAFLNEYFFMVKQWTTTERKENEKEAFAYLLLKKARQLEVNVKTTSFYDRALLATLPYSSASYLDYLFTQNKFDAFIAYFIYGDFSITTLNRTHLQQLEKYYLTGLLAIYHREIKKLILQKNRQSYADAANYLKILKALYKKYDRKTDWDYYISQLVEKTKRQRALLEELKRSKCLDG